MEGHSRHHEREVGRYMEIVHRRDAEDDHSNVHQKGPCALLDCRSSANRRKMLVSTETIMSKVGDVQSGGFDGCWHRRNAS